MGGLARAGARIRSVRLAVATLAATAAVLGAVEIVLAAAGPVEPTWAVVLIPLLGGTYVAAGAVAWLRRPSNQTGFLLVLAGLAWLASALVNTAHAALVAVGQITATVPLAVIVHLLLAFPSGRLRDRRSRVVVAAGYVTTTVLQAPLYLFTTDAPPYDVLQLVARPDLADAGRWVQRLAGGAVMVVTALELRRRLRAASASRRAVLGPLYAYGIAAVLLVPLSPNVVRPLLGISAVTSIVIQIVVLALVPLAFTLGILRGGFARTAEVEELGAWLGTADGDRPALGEALAGALGDPSLRLAFWSADRDGFVDADGRPVEVAPAAGSPDEAGRSSVEIRSGDRLVAAIDYDPVLNAEADLVRAAGQAVALALDRERLTADLRASGEALRESRARILEAGDEERRRIAQDLHDGLQSRLLLAAVEASRAGADAVRGSIEDAVAELRSLVHGVMPPALLERGLYAATEDLVDRLPIPARLVLPEPAVRPAPPVEQVAYFVVAEALANAVKHSRARSLAVRLDRSGGLLRIGVRDDGVGGAGGRGTGLRGMSDRVDALGGRLSVESPAGGGTHVRVELPCGS